jgi:hypothetical protein
MSDEFDEFDSVDPKELTLTMIQTAINLGAPVYNAGDARGCFEIYAATSRMLIRMAASESQDTSLLIEALKESSLESDVDEQAWIIRRAFDEILGEETDEGLDDEPRIDPNLN